MGDTGDVLDLSAKNRGRCRATSSSAPLAAICSFVTLKGVWAHGRAAFVEWVSRVWQTSVNDFCSGHCNVNGRSPFDPTGHFARLVREPFSGRLPLFSVAL